MKSLLFGGIALLTCLTLLLGSQHAFEEKSFKDPRDGQVYPIVKIGDLYWFASNLNFNSKDSECFEDAQISCGDWGRLYPISGFRDACPAGWRVPNISDWQILKEVIDMNGVQSLYQAENWKNNEDASNSTGLSLVPSGMKHKKKFLHQYFNSSIWFHDSTAEGSNWHLHTDGNNNEQDYYFHTHEKEVYVRKFAVRCVCGSANIDH